MSRLTERLESRTLFSAPDLLALSHDFGGDGPESIIGTATDQQGNFYVAGTFTGRRDFDLSPQGLLRLTASRVSGDIFVAKYAPSGHPFWVRQYTGNNQPMLQKFAVDRAGNVLLAGVFGGTVDFDPSPTADFKLTASGAFVSKLDTNGNFLFVNRLRARHPSQNVYGLAVDDQGNFFVAGISEEPQPAFPVDFTNPVAPPLLITPSDTFIIKYNAKGMSQWQKILPDNLFAVRPNAVVADHQGNLFFTADQGSTVDYDPARRSGIVRGYTTVLGKYDSAGNLLFAAPFGNIPTLHFASSLAVDSANNLFVAGSFARETDFDLSPRRQRVLKPLGQDGTDAFVARYSPNSELAWAQRTGGEGTDLFFSLALDSNGNPSIAGSFQGTADFNPTNRVFRLASKTPLFEDIFVAHFSRDGAFTGAQQFGGDKYDSQPQIVYGANDDLWVTGLFNGTIDIDPTVAVQNFTSGEFDTDVFILRLIHGPKALVQESPANFLGDPRTRS